jgi:hypothetical protein
MRPVCDKFLQRAPPDCYDSYDCPSRFHADPARDDDDYYREPEDYGCSQWLEDRRCDHNRDRQHVTHHGLQQGDAALPFDFADVDRRHRHLALGAEENV